MKPIKTAYAQNMEIIRRAEEKEKDTLKLGKATRTITLKEKAPLSVHPFSCPFRRV